MQTSVIAATISSASPAILTSTSCSLCSNQNDPDHFCRRCNRAMCEDCICLCDHITTQHALAAALQALWNEWPTSAQTLLVQDEHGIFYATSGPDGCFLEMPTFEGEVQLIPELHALYGRYQECAAYTQDDMKFNTEHYSVILKVFRLDGRLFTASLIQSIV